MRLQNFSMAGAVALVGVGLVMLSGVIAFASLGNAAIADTAGTARRPVDVANGRTVPSPHAAGGSGLPRRPSGSGRTPTVMGAGDGCVEGQPLAWFGAIRPLGDCGLLWGLPTQDGEAADVNGDGRLEYFGRFPADATFMPDLIASGGEPLPNRGFIYRVVPGLVGTQTMISFASIIDTQPLAEWILAERGWTGEVFCGFGWIDIDGDGDLDLQAGFSTLDAATGDWLHRDAWLENDGFEAARPLTGDLNSDGSVNSADLTLLLGGWTGG